ncbi:MAG: tetratricopeptide repeat protein [Treponema sp.]|jgi:tetratricopeptide (TPR) repeat protein|nr:tetratricopeptide repeat protein [Treponema sp.]
MSYYYQGWDLIREKDYDGAIEAFTKGLEEKPDSFYILGARGGAYQRKGETEKALADYTRMIALKPHNPDGWNSRGNLYHELGEYDKAIADFTQCIPLSPPQYGTYWSNRGISYYAKGDLDAALADFNKSIETWRDDDCTGWARFHRGLVWRKKGELGKALKDFRAAAARDQLDGDSLYQAGYIWFLRGDYDKAIRYFSRAIKRQDNAASFWLARGVCYWNKCLKNKTGFWDEGGDAIDLAEDDFTKVIELAPDMAEAYFNRGMVRCAKAQESNNLIKAILAQKATDEAERVVLLAQLERMGGKDFIPPADAMMRGLRSNRDQADVLMAESAGLIGKEGAREAVEDLSRAVALDPYNAEAYYQRGLAYALLGEADKALADYEQTCALDPAHGRGAGRRDELLKSRK